jgi:hypothetical protein
MLLAAAGLRDDHSPNWLDERRRAAPFAGRKVKVHVKISPEEARIQIAHGGPPLVLAEPAMVDGSPALEDPTDRSLILMRAFMDEVLFHPEGTSLVLVKRRAP